MMFDGLRRRAAQAFAELTTPMPAFVELPDPMPGAGLVILHLAVPEFEAMKLEQAMTLNFADQAEIERLRKDNFELADIGRRQAEKIESLEGELLQMARA